MRHYKESYRMRMSPLTTEHRAFEAGEDYEADFSLPAYGKFRNYWHYRKYKKVGNKIKNTLFKTGL